MNQFAAAGAGRQRQPWRIREFLDAQGLTQADVARKLGKDRSVVSKTIRGTINNREVLRYLHGLGCPEKILSLPADLQQEKVMA